MNRYALIIILKLILFSNLYSQEISMIDTTGFDSLLTKVYQQNSQIKLKLIEINKQKENLFQNKISFLRNFKVGFQFNQTEGLDETSNLGVVPKFGLNIQFDFESIFTTPSKIRQAKETLRATKIDYYQTRVNLKKELLNRHTEFQQAIHNYQIQLDQFRAINELFNIAQKKFANGEIALDEYSKTIEENASARTSLLEAEIQIYRTKSALMELLE